MEAKELNFRGFKANGFLMLAMHLLLISGIIICCFMQMTTPFFILGGVLCKHSDKYIFYTLRFDCSFAAANTIKPQLL